MGLVVLLGASGSGKTTIAQAVAVRHPAEFEVFHFDRIGVPTLERMIADHGSGEAWQRVKTIEWMARLAKLAASGRGVLFEGQTRLSFLAEGAAAAGGIGYVPILVDCDDATRTRRLTHDRGQPELADANMMDWAGFLRREADENGCELLDTSALALEDSIHLVVDRLRAT